MLWISLGCLLTFVVFVYIGFRQWWSWPVVALWLCVHVAGLALAVVAAIRYPHSLDRALELGALNALFATGALLALLEAGESIVESETEEQRGAD